MAENKIVINGDVYTDSEIMSGNAFLSNSLACDELTIDTLDASVNNSRLLGTLFKPKNADGLLTSNNDLLWVMPKIRIKVTDPDAYQFGDEVIYRHDNKLVGKFYVSDVERTGKDVYTVSCVSAIGLLDATTHYGGIYTGETMETVLADIIGGVVPCSISPNYQNLSSQRIYGHLPIDTRRNNLHQLLFAMGASVFKNANGDMEIAPLGTGTTETLGPNRIYLDGSVSQDKKAKRAIITEHSYNAYDSDREIVLYEGFVPSETIVTPKGTTIQGAIVRFDGPMHDLSIEGGTLFESNVNYAVIKPSPNCKLVGKAYTHTTKQIIRENSETHSRSVSVQLQDNDAIVGNATLVSMVNSENVANRVMNYYSSSKKVKAGIVKQDRDKPGMKVKFNDTFGDLVTGYVKSMDINISGTLKAESEVVIDYVPSAIGNNYNNVMILTQITSAQIPQGVNEILLVLIGGGDGGECGAAGESGTRGNEGAAGGEGGIAGNGGNGGKVLIKRIQVVPEEYFYFSPGAGGYGGKFGENQGLSARAGGASTFSLDANEKHEQITYSTESEDAESNVLGYSEIFEGKLYAFPGKPGRAGGRGRDSGDTSDLQPLFSDYEAYPGKTGAWYQRGDAIAYGGGGGGAAFSAVSGSQLNQNGKNGQDAYSKTSSSIHAGTGGDGADAGETFMYSVDWNETGDPDMVQPGAGCGGYGGNGGGGGGGGGSGRSSSATTVFNGDGGAGGKGSDGSDGVSGCAIIYY